MTDIPSTTIKEAYYKPWNSGIASGKSGINLYVRLNENTIILDSVLFRENVLKLKNSPVDSLLYVANLHSDNHKIRTKTSNFYSFDSSVDECVISYKIKNRKGLFYHKVFGVMKRQTINYPSSPTKN
ncbi:hypothetical protein HNV08_00430 [Winogradskyella eckloniae]|uniref:hypothetical protein n=1 Tax=Winogradskyella eckloniae TaxID=1089306 RepID=UPI001564B000|nr:hypothetical protein [Winogradskyella eckloniae]NRD18495.1 hypothetical protein [Winogradskyella eckloniae]